MTTTATPSPSPAPFRDTEPVSNRLPRGAAITDAGVIAQRNIKHLLRTPQLLVFSVAQTVLFLLLFRYVFGGSIEIPGMSFVDYLIPGYLAQIAIFDGFGVAIFFAEDSKSGLIERFRALPMARSAVVGGRALADILRQAALLAIVTVVGLAIGYGFAGSFWGILLAFVIALVWGFALFWVFAAIGLFVRDSETAQAATTPFFILVFVSTSIILVDTLPGWLQPFARNQPLSQVCNAMRGLMGGSAGEALTSGSTTHYVITSFIWCAAITAVFAPLAIYAYRRP
jgi:ABC-2 type transport system permease protein/oleandomycin transport system permease protein